MHLGNSVICPVTGIPMLAMMGVAAFWAFKKAKSEAMTGFNKDAILKTVALTSFVFAMQMLNFAIPGTGSSGHIVGFVLLAILLGPYVAFLSACAILLIQALFFADGGLLALGCNIFNMGFIACFAAYPLVYSPLAKRNKRTLGAILASIVALGLGSLCVPAEALLSGSITLKIGTFSALMIGIHAPIALVEGLFTALIVAITDRVRVSRVLYSTIGIISVFLAGFIFQFASKLPDGLEWSLFHVSDSFVAQSGGFIYHLAELIQAKTAFLEVFTPFLANITGLLLVSVLMLCVAIVLVPKQTKEV